jgi:putative spermidine/putrescine transport system ATP-binding protein
VTSSGLELRHGRVPFGHKPGLDDVTMLVRRGERVALLGPSGVGKTSLLRAIAGLGALSSGTVFVDDRDVTGQPPERRGIVYMHQSPSLFPHISVLANVAFPLHVRGVGRHAARTTAFGLLERVRMQFAAERSPATLSGGQRHRVALARALAAEPAVLLLDEPFASLDPELRAEVRQSVGEILDRGNGPAVVLVTHDVDEAAGVADRLVVLLEGAVAQVGLPADLLASPQSVAVARFLGIPNLVRGVRDERGVVSCALGRCECPGAAGPVAVVVRAGMLRIRPGERGDLTGTVVSVLHRVAGVSVLCDVGGERLLAVPDPGVDVAVGATVHVAIDCDALHVIDEPLDRD